MKTCHINNLYKPYAVGGAERVIDGLVREGDVVITFGPWEGIGSWNPHRTVEYGVIVYRYWVPNIFSYINLSWHGVLAKLLWHKIDIWNWWSGWIVRSILLQEKPDVVNTHNLMGIGFSIPKVIQRLGIKHIHTLHDVQLVEPSGVLPWNHGKDSIVQRVYGWVMKFRFGRPTEIVSLSGFLQDFYRKRNFFVNSNWKLADSNWQLVNSNFSHVSRITYHVSRDDMRRLLFVGSLVKHKGIEVLMNAWEQLSKDFVGELHIVGDGALREKVEEWAMKDHRVTVHGRLEKDEVEKMYETCDVLVFPSICIENRPQVIVEALEHGLAIIAADTGGVSELLERTHHVKPDDASGHEASKTRLVEPGDMDELVGALRAITGGEVAP